MKQDTIIPIINGMFCFLRYGNIAGFLFDNVTSFIYPVGNSIPLKVFVKDDNEGDYYSIDDITTATRFINEYSRYRAKDRSDSDRRL